jgi:acyl carrier protein
MADLLALLLCPVWRRPHSQSGITASSLTSDTSRDRPCGWCPGLRPSASTSSSSRPPTLPSGAGSKLCVVGMYQGGVMKRDQLVDVIIKNVRGLDPPGLAARPGGLDDQTVLLGDDGLLDSLGLVTLLVDVEQAIAEETGIEITLGDDRAVSARSSPFRTVGTLAEYTLELVDGDDRS